ncbi:MAG: extracellular solute-binding protein [Deltaproteobacteria bacterium]|nr:MAG: extracellular solute-binding protein [Deltaproteobacteria bacterium]
MPTLRTSDSPFCIGPFVVKPVLWLLLILCVPAHVQGCLRADDSGVSSAEQLTVYSGRTEALIGPVLERFEAETGVRVRVQYAQTAQLAAALLEEGSRSPADVFLAQDAATMGLLEREGILDVLPPEILDRVDPRFRSPTGRWVGVSGRARVITYHPDRVDASELPRTLDDLRDPRWHGRLGWAPTNASFQAAVAAMVAQRGEHETASWIAALAAGSPRVYPSNTPAVLAVQAGEVDAVLTNHYYLHRLRAEQGERITVRNHYLRGGEAGAFLSTSTAAVRAGTTRAEPAHRLIAHLLEHDAQAHFAAVNFEFPLAVGMPAPEGLPSTESLDAPEIDLGSLHSLETTVRLLREAGALR